MQADLASAPMADPVLLLTGAPGSGKTTTARFIATRAALGNVILRAPLQTCIARATARSVGKLSNADVITQVWNEFADVGPFETHVVDVNDMDPEQLATVVIDRARSETTRIREPG
jgi:tRNA uridine 5-carbamoylmethylation protein Kti12